MVTLIIPVYNAAGYIDVCLDSVCAQTYKDMEVLLIDDGSIDGSASVCDQWAEKDPRIRVIRKENGGVSSARNLGIGEAAGEWLAFIDPDDWLDVTYLERLLDAAEREETDFAECDIWRYNDRTGRKIYRSCSGKTGVIWTLAEHMKYAPTASYKSISRRSLWTDNHVLFPDCAFESPAVYALILALAGKVASVPEPLYYYRVGRPGSLIETGYAYRDGSPNNTLGIEAMRHLISEFKRVGLYGQYEKDLKGIVTYRLSDILATQFYRKKAADYRETADNFRAFLREMYPEGRSGCYMTLGGYNLNRILVHMDQLHDPYGRFNFSSVIAIASGEGDKGYPVRHPNRYRELMLQREEEGAFFRVLREMQPDYLFIDLIEERFDLLVRGSRYLTESDAREGAEDPGPYDKRIARNDAAYQELFRQYSRVFADRVREADPGVIVVVVENYLQESFGTADRREDYPEIETIKEINELLKQCYSFLEEAVPDAIVVNPADDPRVSPWLFTDGAYEYGVLPSHMNEVVNRRIATLIEQRLDAAEKGEDL